MYATIAALPAAKQAPLIKAINTAREGVEAARAKGYQTIGAALDAAAKS